MNNFLKDTGGHGFDVPMPSEYRDSKEHFLTMSVGNYVLNLGIFKLKCAAVFPPVVTPPAEMRPWFGLLKTGVDSFSVDGTVIPYRLAPDAPCSDNGISVTEEYFMACFAGKWRRVRWEE